MTDPKAEEILTDVQAEISKLEADAANTEVGTWVRVHFVWVAALCGILGGFILGRLFH